MPFTKALPIWDDAAILAHRGSKNAVQHDRPYAYFVELELNSDGIVEPMATLLLTNKECPIRCLMCDLWKNTTDVSVPAGSIPSQIAFALAELPSVRQIKLYNAGNFFDAQAVRPDDLPIVAEQLQAMRTVIVECHPKLLHQQARRFAERLTGNLEIAMGLETVHPEVLPRLNKRMNLDDFRRAVDFLGQSEIASRAFLLVRPPYLNETEGIEWACRSLEFAFAAGVCCCVLIPTRAGNGTMEQLQADGQFAPPSLSALEEAFDWGIGLKKGRVFVDLWDIEKLHTCRRCGPIRADRLRIMNHTQTVLPRILCNCGGSR